eukprot:552198-Amphidinium_carterae.1
MLLDHRNASWRMLLNAGARTFAHMGFTTKEHVLKKDAPNRFGDVDLRIKLLRAAVRDAKMPTFVEPRAFRTSQEMFDYVGDNYQGGTKIYLCGSDTLKQADLTKVGFGHLFYPHQGGHGRQR